MSGVAERVARIREAIARARGAVEALRALLIAAEGLLAAAEMLLDEQRPNAPRLRRALDELGSTRSVANNALLGATEAADRALDALGAGTRLIK